MLPIVRIFDLITKGCSNKLSKLVVWNKYNIIIL